jgi:hypothetical protein
MLAEAVHAIGNLLGGYSSQAVTDMDGDDMGSRKQVQGEQQNIATHKSKRLGTNGAHEQRRSDIKTGVGGDDKGRSGDGGATAREQRISNRRALNDLQRQLDDARREAKEREKHIDDQQCNITTLTQEKYRIDREAKEKERKLADSERERNRLQWDVDELRDGIAQMKKQRDLIDQGAKEKEWKLAGSERERIKLQRQVIELQNGIGQAQKHGNTLEQQLQRQDRDAKLTLDQVQSQYSQTQALLEVRTQELKGAQSFLTKADSLSGAEVTSMMEGLNSEILQTAAFIADSFEFSKGKTIAQQEHDAAYSRVTHYMGDGMSHILTSIQHSEDPMLVQIALQSCLAWCSKHFVETWCFGGDPQSHHLISSVYDRVRQSGE